MKKIEVLFICTENSSRSQMAEGLVNHFFKDRAIAFSAGSNPTQVNPLAIKAMAQIGIDISSHYSKSLDTFKNKKFDIVLTLCEEARESCPVFPRAEKTIHLTFKDPAQALGTEQEKLIFFIKTRDQLYKSLVDIFDLTLE